MPLGPKLAPNQVLPRIIQKKHNKIVSSEITWPSVLMFGYCKGGNLIFISGRGLAISSAKQGKSDFHYNLVES